MLGNLNSSQQTAGADDEKEDRIRMLQTRSQIGMGYKWDYSKSSYSVTWRIGYHLSESVDM